jgi:hypothetical protein
MRVFRGSLLLVVLSSFLAVSAYSQAGEKILGFVFPDGAAVAIPLKGTERLPEAGGHALVERQRGVTELDIELDKLKPARLFGGDYNVYALWLLAPGGVVDNAGQVRLSGEKGYLKVATALPAFGMLVTAEPHSMVRLPSKMIVLENRPPEEAVAELAILEIPFQGHPGEYQSVRESLAEIFEEEIEPRNPLDEARTAIRLAERSGAEEYAPGELRQAKAALERAEEAARTGSRRSEVIAQSREAVIWASEAQLQAERRAEETRTEEDLRADDRADRPAHPPGVPQPRETPSDLASEDTDMPIIDRPNNQLEPLRKAFGDLLEIRELDGTLLLDLPETLFEPEDPILTAQGRETLSRIAGALHVLHDMRVGLEGPRHIDDTELDRQRVEAVRAYFLEAGISPVMLTEIEIDDPDPVPPAPPERAVLVVLRPAAAVATAE